MRANEFITEGSYKGGLRKWFKEKWVNLAKKKKNGRGYEECGTSGDKKGYAKCVPAAKASRMTDKEKKSAINRKRAAQKKAGRPGKTSGGKGKTPVYVKTKKKTNENIIETKEICPEPTQDISLNLKNRQKAINEYGYGPLNPDMPNEKFWQKKLEMWDIDDIDEVKKSRCGNCAAFDIRKFTLDCIAKGIDDSNDVAAEDVIKVGQLGYCRFLKFKCAAKRTCDAWVVGGPLDDKKVASSVDENKGLPMPGTYEQEYDMFKSKGPKRITAMTNEEQLDEKWSEKYKRSINCKHPKGFSQRAHCQGRKKKSKK